MLWIEWNLWLNDRMSPWRVRTLTVVVAALLALFIVPASYLYVGEARAPDDPRVRVLRAYLQSVYARDYKKAYGFISFADRQIKEEKTYIRERGAFHGFTRELARKLATFMEVVPVETEANGDRARIKVKLKLPDANSLGALLLDWDEDRLNALSSGEQNKIRAALDRLRSEGALKTIDGEDQFALVKEGNAWRVFLNWAEGIRINFSAAVPPTGVIEVTPVPPQTVMQTGELFTIAFRVANRSRNPVSARIIHRVEPKEMDPYLDLVQCALLIPVKVSPGMEAEYSSTYLLRGDLPEGTKELRVVYEFKVES